MKKLLILIVMCISTITYAKQPVIAQIGTAVSNGIDSGKKVIKNGAEYVDTSSNVKAMYNDIKGALVAMSSSLKVGAEYVFSIMVRQQVVYAVTWLIMFIIATIVCICMLKYTKWVLKRPNFDTEFLSLFGMIIGWIMTCIFSCVCLEHISTIISGLINPQFGAIQDIIDMAAKLRQ